MPALNFQNLKSQQRENRHWFPDNLGLRVHRALSWLQRAEQETDDDDAAFIFYWIAFNAAYSNDTLALEKSQTRQEIKRYFKKIIELDKNQAIYTEVWNHFSDNIRLIIDNQFIYQPFWNHHNRLPGYENWESQFEKSKQHLMQAMSRQDTLEILCNVFDRLCVLRNQLIHGGATWNSSVNREQVKNGKQLLAALVPVIIHIMMENPKTLWGEAYYPVVED